MSNVQQTLKASHEGTLRLGEIEIPCAVLSDGRRVLTQKGLLAVAGRPNRGGVTKDGLLAMPDSLAPFVSPRFVGVTKAVQFRPAQGGRFAYGFPAEILPELCRIYRAADRAGALHPKQRHVATALDVLGDALMGVGIAALVDEATGYQKVRADDALQVKLAAYIAPRLRAWTKTMPDELWLQFAKLEHRTTGPEFRPKYWGRIVNEVIYDALDSDVAQHIRDTRPPSESGRRLHQWFTQDFGAIKLRQHIEQVIAIARTCTTMREFRGRVALAFSRTPAQTFLPLPRAA